MVWVPLLLLLSMPWWLGASAAFAHGAVLRWLLLDHRTLDWRARDWLRVLVHQRGLPTRVEVHKDGVDGYWPAVDCIGLRLETAASTHPIHYAIVAHELGHALTIRRARWTESVLPLCRFAVLLGGQASLATAAVAALYDHAGLLSLAYALAVVAVFGHIGVAFDEGRASSCAHTVLYEELPIELLRRARTALASGFLVYAARAAGAVLLVLAWPLVDSLALGRGFTPSPAANPLAVWLLAAVLPIFALHGGWVLLQVVRPEPIRSAFRLGQLAMREGQWEFVVGVATLLLILTLHRIDGGSLLVGTMALAAVPTVAPAGRLALLAVLLPVGLAWRPVHPRRPPPWLRAKYLVPDDPRSLMSLYSRPPWHLRAMWLVRIAYLPMVAVVVLHLLSR